MAASRLFSSFLYIRFLVVFPFISLSSSQFIPGSDAKARNLTVVHSPANPDVTVSYKTPDKVCSTAFDSQKQYTGWVSVPGDYPTNLFFWFVEAREQTDSLTIWLNGGPGSSSLYGFFTGNGPCEVVEKGLNEYETLVREWGWDRASNMLFIDQVCDPRLIIMSTTTQLTCALSLTKSAFHTTRLLTVHTTLFPTKSCLPVPTLTIRTGLYAMAHSVPTMEILLPTPLRRLPWLFGTWSRAS